MKRVLIIRSGAVGDLILTLPVLAALKKRCEGLSIDMMGDPGRLSLLKQCGYVDNVLPIDSRKFTPLFAAGGARTADADAFAADAGPAQRMLQAYDAILSYLPYADGVFEDNLRKSASGPVVTGRSRPADGRRIHMTRVMMDALEPLGVDAIDDPPEIDPPLGAAAEEVSKTAAVEEVLDLASDRTPIAIHPGSGGPTKCWPAERFVVLIECLVGKGYMPVVTFGPADDTVRRRILPRISDRDVLIVENRPLVDMAVLYARCRAMIGNDSGMTHLAAATGMPVIALFGPTDPAIWGPRGKEVRLLWGDRETDGDVGGLAWQEPFRPRCLSDIDVETPIRLLTKQGVMVGSPIENSFKRYG